MRAPQGTICCDAGRMTQLRNACIPTVGSENARILTLHSPLPFPATRVPCEKSVFQNLND